MGLGDVTPWGLLGSLPVIQGSVSFRRLLVWGNLSALVYSFLNNFIYFGCVGLLLCRLFSSGGGQGLLQLSGRPLAVASLAVGYRLQGTWAQQVSAPGRYRLHGGGTGAWLPRGIMGSSRNRDRTHVSCVGRWTLYHWATREALLLRNPSLCIFSKMGFKGTDYDSLLKYSIYNMRYCIYVQRKKLWRMVKISKGKQ